MRFQISSYKMTSNDDLMEFLKKMEETRKQEKKELVEKIEDVKNEMKGTVKALTDRQDKMELDQEHIKDDIGELRTQMDRIRNIVENSVDHAQSKQQQQQHQQDQYHHQAQPQHGAGGSAQRDLHDYLPSDDSERKQALALLDLGRRTVSLHPFEPKDCDFELKRGAKDQAEAKLWAVQTYLRYEMNIKSHILATFTIEDIFALSEDYDSIYVTFSSVTEANSVFSYTRNMRREAKVGIFVPKEWQDRFKALNTIAYGYRNPNSDQPKYNTRIKWGHSDLVLYRKEAGARYWTTVTLTTPLPAVDLAAVAQPRMSPAPGRNGREHGKRSRPDSSESDSDPDLKGNKNGGRSVRSRSESRQNGHDQPHPVEGDEVHDQVVQDPGQVIHEESYCPASPAPVKKSLQQHCLSVPSPIFKKVPPASMRMNPLL